MSFYKFFIIFYPKLSLKMVYFIVVSCRIYICNCFEGHRVISVLGLLLSVLPSLNKAYYYYYYLLLLDNSIKLPYLRTTPGTQKQKGQKRYPI